MNLSRLIRRSIPPYLKQTDQTTPRTLLRLYKTVPFEDIPEVSPSKIRAFLKKHAVPFEDGHTGFLTACPRCHKGSRATATHVHINKTTGTFACASCKRIGAWPQLEGFLAAKRGKKDEGAASKEAAQISELVSEVQKNTVSVSTLKKEVLSEVLKAFELPVIQQSTINNLDVRIDETLTNLYFPLENVLSETVGYRILNKETNRETTRPETNFTGVLTLKSSRNKDTAVLVPYLSDFLTLANAKVSGSVVCLPNGLLQLPQYVLPALERFNKLILWLGNDLVAWESARNFAKKLGEKRCLFIRPAEDQTLPHLLPPNKNIKTIINTAQPIWHKSVITFASLRQDVLSDLQNIDKIQGIRWSRFPTLTKILKGHRRGELTVITGPTGSGKTTFISEYSLDLAGQGVSTLWGSFEIRNARLARMMLHQMAGIPLDENLHVFDEWADRFEQLPIYFMTFHGQQTIKVVMEAVEHTTYVHDIAHVIIDNVQFMMGMTEAERHRDRFWQQDAIVAAFRTFATRNNCHVTLVIHPRKERDEDDLTASSIFGGAKASQEADNVLIIQDKRLVSVRGKKYLQIVKNRYSGDLGIMPLDFDKAALSYAQKKRRASEETRSESVT